MDNPLRKPFPIARIDLAWGAIALLLDQVTKLWAMVRFGGIPRGEKIRVIGDYFRFELAFNEGAAFSMKPQNLIPWLHPTLFYLLLGGAATVLLVWFYKSLSREETAARKGSILILAGAFGNLIDRIRIGKVIDFIDWDFPDITLGDWMLHRWPTFNLADSFVLIGVGLVLLSPLFLKRRKKRGGTDLETSGNG